MAVALRDQRVVKNTQASSTLPKKEDIPPADDAAKDEDTSMEDAGTGEDSAAEGGSAEGSDGGEEIIAVDKLPDNLKPLGKRMLGSLTKARQKDKEDLQKLEADLTTKFAKHVQRANIFEELAKLPAFEKFWADVESGRDYGYSSQFNSKGDSRGAGNDSDDDEDKPLTKAEVAKMIAQGIGSSLRPFYDKESNAAVDKAKEQYGEKLFEKHRPSVTDYIQRHPGSSIDEAMRVVAHDDLVAAAVAKEIAKLQGDVGELGKKRLRTEKSSAAVGGAGKIKKDEQYDTPIAALSAALKEIREEE